MDDTRRKSMADRLAAAKKELSDAQRAIDELDVQVPSAEEPGHLFVVRSDIRKVVADAWLIPSGGSWMSVLNHWLPEEFERENSRLVQQKLEASAARTKQQQWNMDATGKHMVNSVTGERTPLEMYSAEELQQKVRSQSAPSLPPKAPPPPADEKHPKHQWFGCAPTPLPGAQYVRRVEVWPDGCEPKPYVANLPVQNRLDSIVQAVSEFVIAATEALKKEGTRPRNRRERFLLTLPLLATGFAGLRNRAGMLLESLLPHLVKLARAQKVDLCLVLWESTMYSLVQSCRKKMDLSNFSILSVSDRIKAEELADYAQRGLLSLFIGAGVSIGAGLPSWGTLLEKIAQEAGMTAGEVDRMWNLSFLDQAKLLERKVGSVERLRELIVKQVSATHFSLNHAMLAMLPCQALVTTNYDSLVEEAHRASDQALAVLPYQSERAKGGKFLLKLHGCVNHPKDIVLTREDYLHFDRRRAALSSIVQTQMIRTHILFVGFSLMDDNYIKIVDNVMESESSHTLHGTALFLFSNAFESQLNTALHVYPMCPALPPGVKEGPYAPPAARKLEIFLDFLLMMASTTTGHLMDLAFQDALDPADRQFAHLLANLLNDTPEPVQRTEGFQKLSQFVMTTFGGALLSGAVPIPIPLLVKPGENLGLVLNRLSSCYALENVRVVKLHRPPSEASAALPFVEVFNEGEDMDVEGDTLMHDVMPTAARLGVLGVPGVKKHITLRCRVHLSRNDSFDEDDSDLTTSLSSAAGPSVKCHFWLATGACRLGYKCPWRHSYIQGLPSISAKPKNITQLKDSLPIFTPDPGNLVRAKKTLKPVGTQFIENNNNNE